MKKSFVKSLAAGIIGLSLATSCSMMSGKNSHKCGGKNSCSANGCKSKKSDSSHKCGSNGCKSAKK